MRKKMQSIQKRFKVFNDEEFLSLFEQRNLFFIADGTDMNNF